MLERQTPTSKIKGEDFDNFFKKNVIEVPRTSENLGKLRQVDEQFMNS